VLAGLALLVSACGTSAKHATTPPAPKGSAAKTPSPRTPTPASEEDVAVIRGWTDALRHGHVNEAAEYFALPAVVSNGTPPIRLTKRAHVRFFNRTLPCGARFKEASDTGASVVATLVLTERPGAGKCGKAAVGNEAYTAFMIRRHKIVQWRRVVAPPAQPTPEGPES
jgi:hypothetical protein